MRQRDLLVGRPRRNDKSFDVRNPRTRILHYRGGEERRGVARYQRLERRIWGTESLKLLLLCLLLNNPPFTAATVPLLASRFLSISLGSLSSNQFTSVRFFSSSHPSHPKQISAASRQIFVGNSSKNRLLRGVISRILVGIVGEKRKKDGFFRSDLLLLLRSPLCSLSILSPLVRFPLFFFSAAHFTSLRFLLLPASPLRARANGRDRPTTSALQSRASDSSPYSTAGLERCHRGEILRRVISSGLERPVPAAARPPRVVIKYRFLLPQASRRTRLASAEHITSTSPNRHV